MRAASSSAPQLAYVTRPVDSPERGSSRTADYMGRIYMHYGEGSETLQSGLGGVTITRLSR